MATVPAGAENNREKPESMNMDGLASVLNECSTKVMVLNQSLEEAKARKSKLQNVLKMMQQRNAKLRSQVEKHRVQDQVRRECERKELNCIEQLNKNFQAHKEELKLKESLSEELHARKSEEVNQFEDMMREVRSEFQMLLESEDKGIEDVAKEHVELTEEVARLEDERSRFTTDDTDHFSSDLAPLLSAINDGSEFLETLKEKNRKSKDEEAALKQKLESLKQTEKTGSIELQDTHTTQH